MQLCTCVCAQQQGHQQAIEQHGLACNLRWWCLTSSCWHQCCSVRPAISRVQSRVKFVYPGYNLGYTSYFQGAIQGTHPGVV
jgi:hypothetical protein